MWDDTLSRLIGTQTSHENEVAKTDKAIDRGSEGDNDEEDEAEDGEGEEEDDMLSNDDDKEPDSLDDDEALFANVEFEYNLYDPAGLKIAALSTSDAARYNFIKAERIKAGKLQEWKKHIVDAVVEVSSILSLRSLTNAKSKAAAKKMKRELERYVMSFNDI